MTDRYMIDLAVMFAALILTIILCTWYIVAAIKRSA